MNDQIQELQARIADLESQLYDIGASGEGQSIKPQVQDDTAQEPVAWRVRPFNYGIGHEGVDALTTRKEQCEMWERKGWIVEPLYAAPQPTENLRCKSTQKRLATLWGYVKPQHLQPLTDEQMYSLYCEAMKGYYVSALHYWRNEEAHKFARAIEAAVANQPPRQPLTDDAKRLDWLMLNISGAEFRRIGIEYSGICTRKDIDNAIERENGITGDQ